MLPIVLQGARTNNLKGVSLEILPGELVAITGPSGAGKSSLAQDTLYAEGQRRFVESFSPYARQFLDRLDRPPMDRLDPIAAGICVDRRAPIKSSRSTVATMADLEPYVSALYACEARPRCPACDVLSAHVDPQALAERIIRDDTDARASITYALRTHGTESLLDARETLLRDGYRRVIVAGRTLDVDELAPSLVLGEGRGVLSVVVDRIKLARRDQSRLAAALESALARGNGPAEIFIEGREAPVLAARGLVCPKCAKTFDSPSPGLFSYQSPLGACEKCKGFGRTIGLDFAKVIPDERLSIQGGAIRPWGGKSSQVERRLLKKYCETHAIPQDRPWVELTKTQQQQVLHGEGSWTKGRYPGVAAWFEWLETRTYKMHVRVLLSRYRSYDSCKACDGKRLSPRSLTYEVAGIDLGRFHQLEIDAALSVLASIDAHSGQGRIARGELVSRLSYLQRVGLGYLTLDRASRTLSGGEAQRVSLTAALGTALTGALFVLDEPTVGLHPSDIAPLVAAMRELAEHGSAVLVVEHDPAVIAACDRVIELGPGAGEQGGELRFDGTVAAAKKRKDLATARAFASSDAAPCADAPPKRGPAVVVRGAAGHNLKGIDVRVPLGCVVAVTGPSGSGKSSLVADTLYAGAMREMGRGAQADPPIAYRALDGLNALTDIELVDQAPLGKTSRGNPATYSNAWNRVRALFAAEPLSARLGLGPGAFSFNVAGGRCEDCSGEGSETVEMQFLADVVLPCATCSGKRFKPEVLGILHREKSISDVLAMSVAAGLSFFDREAAIVRALSPLAQLGLGYLKLGQPLPTLSGGEAQRLKLARALADTKPGKLILLDEPSAGLHADEVEYVFSALDALVRSGASVVLVDHDLSLIRRANWVIELGPGGGLAGGNVVFEGTPFDLKRAPTKTGEALRTPPSLIATRSRTKPPTAITVSAAREHNLKEISVSIPHQSVVVVTGPSGSGKSSLAFDVVFAEGQRRFMETLTPYARQFLPTLARPDVDSVMGVPPSIALEQRTTRSGPTSTVATVTEIAQYLRLLYAKVGTPYCPSCDLPIEAQEPNDAFQQLCTMRGSGSVLAPAVVARKGTYLDIFTAASRAGIADAVVDGAPAKTDRPPRLKKTQEHTILLRLYEGPLTGVSRELFDAGLSWGKGQLWIEQGAKTTTLSTRRSCASCGEGVPELDPRFFSFNTKQGRCEGCEGSGVQDAKDPHSEKCPSCEGARLSPLPRAVRLGQLRYHEFSAQSVSAAHRFALQLSFEGRSAKIANAPRSELLRRLAFVEQVGLGYLSLDRLAATLSGGEMQRLRLSAQLGSGLTGALYVLDEPTIGLHPRDTQRLLTNLRQLADMGSTVLIVEHDVDTILAADHVIDLGPTGGRGGGQVLAAGSPQAVLDNPQSPTGRALRGAEALYRARPPRGDSDRAIVLTNPRAHNLKLASVRLPVGRLNVVAGVSGSGKSTLVDRVMVPAARRKLGLVDPGPAPNAKLEMPKEIGRVLCVDQAPIGRTPRSVPATFLGIFDHLRKLFAKMPEAQIRGFGPARFSFNTSQGGRCVGCDGQGVTSHEMSFLPDVTTLCESCGGSRYEAATLEVKYLGLSIGEVLDLSAEEACGLFAAHPKIQRPLAAMVELGLGYLKLGQGSHTLSGGEAQRLKLAAELTGSERSKPALIVLDEPTTGLHLSDAARLLTFCDRLLDRGDTLVVIEHHPLFLACADWLTELGPEAGAQGGELVASGPPSAVREYDTPTGRVLRSLAGDAAPSKPTKRPPRKRTT